MVVIKYPDVEKQVYYNEDFYHVLVQCKAMVYHDRDFKGVYAGRSRVGKSVLAMQHAKFFDPSFDDSRIVYNPRDFVELANKLSPGSAIMLDETRHAGGGDWAQGKESKIFLDYLNEVGQKNLYILLLLPDFWDLRTALATNLTHYMVHVYEEENQDFNPENTKSDPLTRGHFDFYNFEDKRYLFYHNHKYHSYKGVKPSMKNLDFSNTFVVNEANYRAKKFAGLEKYADPRIWETGATQQAQPKDKALGSRGTRWLVYRFKQLTNWDIKTICNFLELDDKTVGKYVTQYTKEYTGIPNSANSTPEASLSITNGVVEQISGETEEALL